MSKKDEYEKGMKNFHREVSENCYIFSRSFGKANVDWRKLPYPWEGLSPFLYETTQAFS